MLDTQLLLWAADGSDRLPDAVLAILAERTSEVLFSSASIWEVAIKQGLQRPDFRVDARILRRGLVEHHYRELPVTGAHAAAVADLPPIHKDPFDRLLVAQATVDGILLLTSDAVVARYPGPIRRV